MSDYNRIDGAALDRWITGNYGEDQVRDSGEPCDCGDADGLHYHCDDCPSTHPIREEDEDADPETP